MFLHQIINIFNCLKFKLEDFRWMKFHSTAMCCFIHFYQYKNLLSMSQHSHQLPSTTLSTSFLSVNLFNVGCQARTHRSKLFPSANGRSTCSHVPAFTSVSSCKHQQQPIRIDMPTDSYRYTRDITCITDA